MPTSLRPCAVLALSTLCLQPIARADVAPKVGGPAPPLTLRQLLQAPAGIHGTWQELKGQAVVVEFWATWCGGCVDNIPHLNELAEQFKSKPIQFISVTDETDVELVEEFMKRHPMRGWVAFDAEGSTFKRYGVEGRPQTLLVDQSGVLRAITNPPSVTPNVLEDLLAGKPLDLREPASVPSLGFGAGATMPLVQVLIRPAAPVAVSGFSPGGEVEKNGKYDLYGETLREILSAAYDIPANRVDAPDWCAKARYDLSVTTPQHEEASRWLLVKQTLEMAFSLRLHQEMKETPVYVLKRVDGQQPRLRPATTGEKGGLLESPEWRGRHKGRCGRQDCPDCTVCLGCGGR